MIIGVKYGTDKVWWNIWHHVFWDQFLKTRMAHVAMVVTELLLLFQCALSPLHTAASSLCPLSSVRMFRHSAL
jgi:hypothetical protein